MVITWMAELNPKMKDAWASRHIITLIPSDNYHIVDGENITLQCVMQEIINCFEQMATQGIQGTFFEVTGIKGDWKFHRQVALLKRHYNNVRCCHQCCCTKDLTMPFTDLSAGAAWRSTILDENFPPWENPPVLTNLHGFTPAFLLPDLLHVWFLGCGRDIAGSAVYMLVKSRFWPGRYQKQRFRHATNSFKKFLKDNRLEKVPRKWKFTSTKLNMKENEFVHFKDKGHRTGLVLRWLWHELNTKDCGNPHVHSVIWASHHAIGIMGAKSHFLTKNEGKQVRILGEFLLREFLILHQQGYPGKMKVWQIRPKWHLLHHIFLSCDTEQDCVRNPWIGTCFMDEDMLKKTMAVTKKCHPRTAATNTLKRFLLGLKSKFDQL